MNFSNIGCDTIHFVYLGYPLPKYAVASLKLAKEYSGMKVHLLASEKNKKFIDSLLINFTALEDFYDNKIFDILKEQISSSATFRNYFWIRTAERLFVLSQFVQKTKIKNFFHAELDQLLFGVNELVLNIEKSKKSGIFIPFHSNTEAVASVFYCNNMDALTSLLTAARTTNYIHEMELIATWAKNNPNLTIALPTIFSKFRHPNILTPKNITELLSTDLNGIVDGMEVGQWIAGVDPRNVNIFRTPKNKWIETSIEKVISRKQFEKFQFHINFKNFSLDVFVDDIFITKIYNLHIHSKIHPTLTSLTSLEVEKKKLVKFFEITNQEKAVTLESTRGIQINYFINSELHNLLDIIRKPERLLVIFRKIIKKFQ
jgi:hypothetical protein